MRVVYHSFSGRYSDSPRAVYEALLQQGSGHEHVWLADPAERSRFPRGAVTVDMDPASAVPALESAHLVVSNSHLVMDWRKAAGATYVQTWHGTPLKRIHADVPAGPPGLLETLSLDVDRWDVLLSPNAFSTATFRRAFRWSGEVLETGYPRNDVLLSPRAPAVRAEVRRELGIEDGRTAVLYTPTWRDDAYWSSGAGGTVLALDLERFAAELGDDHVLLLRLHYLLSGHVGLPTGHVGGAAGPAVLDVSRHPDVAELYLAADLMVTDYSSTMFDFAVTGKPLLFFTYDYDHYRDDVRGFYFDLAAQAPGPLLATNDALFAAIADSTAVRTAYAERYAAFRQQFCPLDDGHATQRLLDRVLP